MRWSLRKRLFAAFVGVALVSAILTVPTGSLLISRMVVGEAQRRVDLALTTAHDMLAAELQRAQRAAEDIAESVAPTMASGEHVECTVLAKALSAKGCDFLHLVTPDGNVLSSPGGRGAGRPESRSDALAQALSGTAASAVSLLPLGDLEADNPDLAAQARVPIIETPRASPGGPEALGSAVVLDAAAPVLGPGGEVLGAVRLGTVINGNFSFVDAVRLRVFSTETHGAKNVGTVTIFQGDVRVATNVVGPGGDRAVGTRVSEEVDDQVLLRGEIWRGPAFVVDAWYISGYEPLRDLGGDTVGMLYVGVLKARYDEMRAKAMGVFLGIAMVALVLAAFLAHWIAGRMSRPLADLTEGAVEVSRGNLDYQLSTPPPQKSDEIGRLTSAFTQMVASLKERDERLRAGNVELEKWVQNYLDILEFITHELKNHIAAMGLNVSAVREGYVGEITDEQREALEDVSRTIDRSQEMILNYLNLSRIEKRELQVHPQPLNLEPDILRPVLKEMRGALDERGVSVEVELPAELLVQADPSLLRIVFSNLISNAIKYGDERRLIRISGGPVDQAVEVHVWNAGRGLPPDKMGQLFQRFARLGPPIDELPGTGLGLFIAREILLQHGGDIRAESEHREWIDFIVSLPAPSPQSSRRQEAGA